MSEQIRAALAELHALTEKMNGEELNRVLGFALGVTASKPVRD